ncbi:aldehyde dehydrogenase (NADP(+)) [Spirillospora sp. NPDC048819]|uniref:aldehyde dehydrogenase (NADP(+)) n=1 Tax=Spirillospora sp. NPDC048819 TaxID=3155268 RepID=UPI0033C10FF6
MTTVTSVDARTGKIRMVVGEESTHRDVDATCARAAFAFPTLEAMGRDGRARLLRAMADGLEDERAAIVAVADDETALGEQRLDSELTRTCFQLRAFAGALEEGSYLEATIDHAAPTPMGPRPDVRRMLVPVGPVAVFGASNFPLAFSVPGGDTAAALAAGCPVVLKAHPSHPATSRLCFDTMTAAAAEAGAPEGTLGLLYGRQAGIDLVRHGAIRAVGFTGSYRGGRALFDVACSRPDPIPFYGELGSVNPLVITPAAAAERGSEIAAGYVDSFTLGSGQFCTKPGLAFIPAGKAGTQLITEMADRVRQLGPSRMLNAGIHDAFVADCERLSNESGVEVVATAAASADANVASAVLYATRARDFTERVLEECFGPAAVLLEYSDEAELMDALGRLKGNLTATVHTGDDETDLPARLAGVLIAKAGRLVWNGYPTGVAITHAMQHGGPHPATTNPLHTSVGTTSIRRFLRPVAWQNAPQAVLPPELRDVGPAIPRRIEALPTWTHR